MSTLYDRLTEDQVKIILNGVKNDVDYSVIAEQAGLSHKKRVSEFLTYRLIHGFTAAKDARAKEIEL